jgi:uncharacterized protein YegL
MARRLPIYLVLDTSGSMSGAPINSVNQGLQMFQAALQSDPRALETAYVSLITFDSSARQVVPLVECGSLVLPSLTASGTTSMGEALRLVEECISREVVTNSTEARRGDWKPLVFVFSDGQPTDEWESAANSLKQRGLGNFVACAAGAGADEHMLKRLTEAVVKLSDTSEQQIKAFFDWVTQSVKVASASVGTSGAMPAINLPPPPPNSGIVIVP